VLEKGRGSAEVDRAVLEGHERLQRDIEEAERRDREGEEMEGGYTDVLDAYNR
jgi:checkpoint serine/threonine-protein kinase